MAGTLLIPEISSANTTADPRIKTAVETLNGLLGASNKIAAAGVENETITNTQLAAAAKPFDWYTPKVIATEQTRENVAFGTLTTADEIASVVLPENGLIVVGYTAIVKSSVAGAGKVAIFVGANQLKVAGSTVPVVQEGSTVSTGFTTLFTCPKGIVESGGGTSFVTTGQALAESSSTVGGLCYIFAAAGTYAMSVQYKATSGSVTAKERKLWVGVMGV